MKLDRAEMILKATSTRFLADAVLNLHLSICHSVAYERATSNRERIKQAWYAMYHQLLALEADAGARMCDIESDEMHKFMHLFFATNSATE